jgi:hypothetical protein
MNMTDRSRNVITNWRGRTLLPLLAALLVSCAAGQPGTSAAAQSQANGATANAQPQTDAAGDCSDIMAVKAWHGKISFSRERDVVNEDHVPEHIIYRTSVDVEADLAQSYRNENNVGFATQSLTGLVSLMSEEHDHDASGHRVERRFAGEGAPGEGSRMIFNLDADCGYGFYLIGGVSGKGMAGDEAFQGVNGFSPLRGEFEGASMAISGGFEFPVYHPSEIEASVDKPIWISEHYDVGDMLSGTDLGTVTVTWNFTPVD